MPLVVGIALIALVAYWIGRRRGHEAGYVAGRRIGIAVGAALIEAIEDGHECTEHECAIEHQRSVARWQ